MFSKALSPDDAWEAVKGMAFTSTGQYREELERQQNPFLEKLTAPVSHQANI